MFFHLSWMSPDALREYFTNDEEWEAYCNAYTRQLHGQDDDDALPTTPIIKPKTSPLRCKGCGKFMSRNDAYMTFAGDAVWHMRSKCLTKLFNFYVLQNTNFDWFAKLPWV